MSNETRFKITAETSDFQRNVTGATRALREFSGAASSSFTGINAGTATIAALGAGFALVARNAINMGDAVFKASQKVGISTETLSALRVAGKLADVSFEELQTSLGKLAKNMDGATVTGSEQAKAFARIGVSVKGANGELRSADAVFADIAEAFKNMPDGAQKTAIAMELFGKSGAQLIPLLNGGAQGLADMRAEAERLGVVISTQTGKDAEAFNDNLTRLGMAAEGAGLQFASGLLPALKGITNALTESTKAGDGFASTGQAFGQLLIWLSSIAIGFSAFVRNVGIDIAATAAMAWFAIQGEFSKAAAVWEERNKDIAASNEATAASLAALSRTASDESSKTAEALKQSAAAGKEAAKAHEQALKDQAKAAKEAAKATHDLLETQIKDQTRLRDAVRKAAEESLAEAKKFAEQAKKLREQAGEKLANRKEQADEKRAGLLSPEAQDERNLNNAKALSNEADILSAKAFLSALEGKNDIAAKQAEDALKIAEKAAGIADRVKDAEVGAGLLEQIGTIEEAATKVQAGLAEKKSEAATTQAQAQFKLAEELTAKVAALQAQVAALKVSFDTSAADGQLEALRAKAAEPVVIPVTTSAATAAPATPARAYGGPLPGRAPHDRADNMLYWGTPGEWVVQRPAVRHYGSDFIRAINEMRLPKYAYGGAIAGLRLPSPGSLGGGKSSLAPAVFNIPGVGSVPVSMEADVVSSLKAAFSREALRKGRR